MAAGEILDFGSGYSGTWIGWYPDRELNPQYEDLEDLDRCMLLLTCPHGEGGVTVAPDSHARLFPTRWKVESWEPLTLSPSIHRLECGCHGFIREGRWIPA